MIPESACRLVIDSVHYKQYGLPETYICCRAKLCEWSHRPTRVSLTQSWCKFEYQNVHLRCVRLSVWVCDCSLYRSMMSLQLTENASRKQLSVFIYMTDRLTKSNLTITAEIYVFSHIPFIYILLYWNAPFFIFDNI